MRKFIIAIVMVLGFFFIVGRFSELETFSNTIQRGVWIFIFLAVLTEVFWLLLLPLSFKVIYQVIGIKESLLGLLPVVLSANFVNIIAPSAGVSGITMLIAHARRQGYSSARAMIAGSLFVEFDYFGFLCMLMLGLLVLVRRNNLTAVEITASLIFGLVALVMTILLYLGTQSAEALGNALTWISRLVNRVAHPFIHRQYLSEVNARSFAHDAAEGLSEFRLNPRKILQPILLALLNKSLLVLVLFFVFLAFKVPVTPGTIIAGFSIGYLFLIVSPTPAGLGFVEGSLTLVLSSMYISLETAAILTLVYRGITFWMPFVVGMVAFRVTGTTKKDGGRTQAGENAG